MLWRLTYSGPYPEELEEQVSSIQGLLEQSQAEAKELKSELERQKSEAQELQDKLTQANLRLKELHDQLERDRAVSEDLRCRLAKQTSNTEELQLKVDRHASGDFQNDADGPTEVYDVILKTASLQDFVNSGRIQVAVSSKSVLEIAKQNRYQVVAVAGLFDKGKTFLINALWGAKLPSGKLSTTEGLSMLWIEEDHILVVDSAGIQAPVSYRDNAEALMDAQITETFLFELLSRFAHHLLYIVSDFTSLEQRYCEMLHQNYIMSKRRHPLIVVHNMKETSRVEEAKYLFESQLKSRYEGIEHRRNPLLFVADRDPPVHHIGLCRVPSEAADKFNKTNLDHLHGMFSTINVLGEKNSLADLLKKHIQDTLPKHVLASSTQESAKIPKNPEGALKIEFEPCENESMPEDDRYNRVGDIVIKAQRDAQFELKKRGSTSALGELILYDVAFDPKVIVYDEGCGSESRRVIRVECPGVDKEQLKVTSWPNGVKIRIAQAKAIDEMSVEAVEPIIQTHGVWERTFEYPSSHGLFRVLPHLNRLDRGVLTVTLGRVQECVVPFPSDMSVSDSDGCFTIPRYIATGTGDTCSDTTNQDEASFWPKLSDDTEVISAAKLVNAC